MLSDTSAFWQFMASWHLSDVMSVHGVVRVCVCVCVSYCVFGTHWFIAAVHKTLLNAVGYGCWFLGERVHFFATRGLLDFVVADVIHNQYIWSLSWSKYHDIVVCETSSRTMFMICARLVHCHHSQGWDIIGHFCAITLCTLHTNGTISPPSLAATGHASLSTVFSESCLPREFFTFPLVAPTRLCVCVCVCASVHKHDCPFTYMYVSLFVQPLPADNAWLAFPQEHLNSNLGKNWPLRRSDRLSWYQAVWRFALKGNENVYMKLNFRWIAMCLWQHCSDDGWSPGFS